LRDERATRVVISGKTFYIEIWEMPNKKNHQNKKNCEMAKTIAKRRDKYICQRCGSNKNIHWSHIICEKRDHRLACDPENIIALCYSCHFFFRHKHPIEAAKRLDSKFPWLADRLWAKFIENQSRGSIPLIRVEEQTESLKSQLAISVGSNRQKV
jgi:late competence protein required for DNA uptake (superfamily II DNA/RNA helicase)